MKTHFFSRKALPTTFLLCNLITLVIPHSVWFGQLLNPMNKTFYKKSQKFEIREVRKSQYEDPLFSLGKLYQKFVLHCTLITLLILNTEFGLIWTTPWPDENDFFLKLSKNRNSPNSQNSVWKPIFFLGKLYKQLFALQAHYTGDTPHRVWLDLDNSLTRWKRPIFKIPFSQNSRNSVWNSNFFAGQAIPQILFALHCHYTVDTQYRVWFDLDNSLSQWKNNYF